MENVSSNVVKNVENDEEVKMEMFWADGPCLIYFLRRFGCQICRFQAKLFSDLAPQLKERKVRMVAIGPERLGWEEFVKGNFWDGEVYYDPEKKLYNELGLKRMSVMSLVGGFFKKGTWDAVTQSKQKGVSGNFKGDYYQLGGLFVVEKGGNKLYEFRQDDFSQHPDVVAAAKSLGIDYVPPVVQPPAPVCNSESCTLPANNDLQQHVEAKE